MIEYRRIYKAFDIPVLTGVDMTVETGEMFALFGPSGTGKSVLLKTTLGLIIPDRGDVEIDGESVYHGLPGTIERIRRKIGFVFQHAALFDSLNVFENVSMGLPESELARMPKQDVARRVWDALEIVNLEPREILGKLPSELSGGMKKRVGIARAIVGRPEILLWDEPVTGLDPINTAAVERLIHSGIPVLNQAVLLRGVNDSVEALAALSEGLVDARVIPYYLHQLDKVAGAAHFEVPVARGLALIEALRARLPGYAVPRYVRETAGEAGKSVLA